MAAAAYRVIANNLSRASENKIHDDTVARRFGFTGGLVPGVEVYAYAAHPAVAHWGRAWLERGTAEIRFLKPVYDGAEALANGTVTPSGLDLSVQSGGVLCATGSATLAAAAATFAAPWATPAPPGHADRPPADEASLAEGRLLGTRPLPLTGVLLGDYLAGIAETDPIYLAEGLAHPGLILRQCNQCLMQNVALGPWIHVGHTVRHGGVARLGQALSACARVLRNFDSKGHRLVELDVLVLADGAPVAEVRHTAIYRPRQLG